MHPAHEDRGTSCGATAEIFCRAVASRARKSAQAYRVEFYSHFHLHCFCLTHRSRSLTRAASPFGCPDYLEVWPQFRDSRVGLSPRYHPAAEANAQKAFNLGGQIVAGVDGHANLVAFGPTYIFATPVLGGQAAVSLFGIAGSNLASVSATLTGPLGRTISGSRTDSLTSFGDLLPQLSLKWNQGVSNYMIYGMGDIPVG
jgi:hypothetical protein